MENALEARVIGYHSEEYDHNALGLCLLVCRYIRWLRPLFCGGFSATYLSLSPGLFDGTLPKSSHIGSVGKGNPAGSIPNLLKQDRHIIPVRASVRI